MSGRMRSMTDHFFCGLTKMAGVKRGADAAFHSSSSDSTGGSSAKKPRKRQFTKSTFDKWQREHEREHQTLTWLQLATLYCVACRKYEKNICSLKSFSSCWITAKARKALITPECMSLSCCAEGLCPAKRDSCQSNIVLA